MLAPGLLLVLLWLGFLFASAAAAVAHLIRCRGAGLLVAAGLVAGSIATAGLVSALLGLLEGAWPWTSGPTPAALAIGLAGLSVSVLCWRAVLLHRRPGPGQCPACRYPVTGMERCPECGRVITPN
jgi:hypothetical protein